MILADRTLRFLLAEKTIVVDPFPQDWQFQPASIDLTLGDEFVEPYQQTAIENKQSYTILPGECVLATTAERIELPDNIVARVEGKSSWGRRFILTHVTAGFIDPGFRGQITLELVNLSRVPQTLPVGQPIAQISFQTMNVSAERPYGHPQLGSHYQDQMGTTASVTPWA